MTEIVPLTPEHLDKLLEGAPELLAAQLGRSYFSPDSLALCLVIDGEPCFSGGLVSLQWHRAEGWVLPSPFFRQHLRVCLREIKRELPRLAAKGGFRRIQATCVCGLSGKLFKHLGFEFEGIMKSFGPKGEDCEMWSKVFSKETEQI